MRRRSFLSALIGLLLSFFGGISLIRRLGPAVPPVPPPPVLPVPGTDLVVCKGSAFFEAGFVYAPYIPFYSTPTIVLEDFRAHIRENWEKRVRRVACIRDEPALKMRVHGDIVIVEGETARFREELKSLGLRGNHRSSKYSGRVRDIKKLVAAIEEVVTRKPKGDLSVVGEIV